MTEARPPTQQLCQAECTFAESAVPPTRPVSASCQLPSGLPVASHRPVPVLAAASSARARDGTSCVCTNVTGGGESLEVCVRAVWGPQVAIHTCLQLTGTPQLPKMGHGSSSRPQGGSRQRVPAGNCACLGAKTKAAPGWLGGEKNALGTAAEARGKTEDGLSFSQLSTSVPCQGALFRHQHKRHHSEALPDHLLCRTPHSS